MKTILGLILVLSLTGCYQKINSNEVKQAEKYCGDKGGVYSITEYAFGSTVVHCISGIHTGDRGFMQGSN